MSYIAICRDQNIYRNSRNSLFQGFLSLIQTGLFRWKLRRIYKPQIEAFYNLYMSIIWACTLIMSLCFLSRSDGMLVSTYPNKRFGKFILSRGVLAYHCPKSIWIIYWTKILYLLVLLTWLGTRNSSPQLKYTFGDNMMLHRYIPCIFNKSFWRLFIYFETLKSSQFSLSGAWNGSHKLWARSSATHVLSARVSWDPGVLPLY